MDQKTKEKIEKFHGLDFCEHGNTRMRCPKCMWDVPAIWRNEAAKDAEEREKFRQKGISS